MFRASPMPTEHFRSFCFSFQRGDVGEIVDDVNGMGRAFGGLAFALDGIGIDCNGCCIDVGGIGVVSCGHRVDIWGIGVDVGGIAVVSGGVGVDSPSLAELHRRMRKTGRMETRAASQHQRHTAKCTGRYKTGNATAAAPSPK